jgi:peptide subunit release factor 1 (eRF1)
MLTDRDLHDLLNHTSPEPMLSVYFNTDPAHGGGEALPLQLNNLLSDVDLPEDRAKVIDYYEQLRDGKGRGLVMFSCVKNHYFKAYILAVPMRSRVYVGDHPYVKPLADLLDAFGGYGVVLVDKQGARLFQFHLGELVEQEGTLGKEIHHSKGRASSSSPGGRGGFSTQPRNNEEMSARNIREAVEFSLRFFEEKHIRRILIGGTDENVAQYRRYLPKSWQSLVLGSFAMSMTTQASEVYTRALEIGQHTEQVRENQLVEVMITEAAKGKEGVVRLEETLAAVHAGRVKTLIVQEGLRMSAYQCSGCGHLTVQELEACPFCGKTFEKIQDAVELAVRKVMQAGGDVEIVRDNMILKELGIGALTWY